jgi:hypothetical protein
MELKYIKNIQFTRLIKVDGQLKEFNFRKPNAMVEGPFTVDTIDARGNRIIFNMEMHDSGWHITTASLPAWITDNEHALHRIIDEEFRAVKA